MVTNPLQNLKIDKLSPGVVEFLKTTFEDPSMERFNNCFNLISYGLTRHKGGTCFHTFIFEDTWKDNYIEEVISSYLDSPQSPFSDGEGSFHFYTYNMRKLYLTILATS